MSDQKEKKKSNQWPTLLSQFHILTPFLTLDEFSMFVPFMRHPTHIILFNDKKGIQLTLVWFTLIKHHWRLIVKTNRLARWRRQFRWSNETMECVYGEIYRQFVHMYPNGPGRSSVEEIDPVPVSIIPELFVPIPNNQILEHPDLLFLYSQLAYYVNECKADHIVLFGEAFQNQTFRSHYLWMTTVPGIYYEFVFPQEDKKNDEKELKYTVESNYKQISFPATTSYERFAVARFLMNIMLFGAFNFSVFGSGRKQLPEDVKWENRLIVEKKYQIYMRLQAIVDWSITVKMK